MSPKLDSHWNARRAEVTHKVGKAGTSAFLLFNTEELGMLRDLIERALDPRAALGGTDLARTS